MRLLLTRTTAPYTIRFFYACFKQGVIDACEYGDDLGAKEFYEEKKSDWTLGFLGSDDTMDWQSFRFRMYWIARKCRLKTLAESYLFRIRKKDYSWAILLYCMRFYLLGVKEWLDYPNPSGIELFKSKSNVHWDPKSPIPTMTRMDIISYLHEFEFEYRKAPEERKDISESAMSSFISALYDLSRKYVTGKYEE